MSTVFSNVLSPAEIDNFHKKLQKKSKHTCNCIIWQGCQNKDGYGIIRPIFRGRRVTLTVHRLAYYIYKNNGFLSRKMHVSHLCHDKLCINTAHLSYETQKVNNARNHCYANARCRGHKSYPNCIFE